MYLIVIKIASGHLRESYDLNSHHQQPSVPHLVVQMVVHQHLASEAKGQSRPVHMGFLVDTVALGQVTM